MKSHFKILTVGLLLLCNASVHGQVEKLISQLHTPKDKNVMVAAHRGDWRNAPENSLQAYKQAIDMGVDVVEVDVKITKDGVLVIMHDDNIDRTSDGKGKPSDYTLAELKKFHLKEGHGVITKHTIPTLEEVMMLAKGKVLVNLDQSFPFYNEAYQVLKKTGTLNQAIFKTSEPYELARKTYPNILDSITFMPVVYIDKPKAKQVINEYQKKLKPVAFELVFPSDTSSILKNNDFIRDHGSKVWINALWPSLNGGHDDTIAWEDGNIKDSWDWLTAHGANMIQTDRPLTLLNYLRKKSLHQ
jgi:glycerophosphoryl diester phosphodiesterase